MAIGAEGRGKILAPVGLSPTVHASLRWTRTFSVRICLSTSALAISRKPGAEKCPGFFYRILLDWTHLTLQYENAVDKAG
jgi:hypothetical protein